MEKVSVIIVNYNGIHLLESCLESLRSQSFGNMEIILVDNASDDGSSEHVRGLYPEVRVITLPSNMGFAAANKEGLKYASGGYILLVNNDVTLEKGCVQNLFSSMETHPEAGIGATKMLVSGKEVIDSAGDGFSTSLKGFKRGEGKPSSFYDKEEYVFGACAGAAIYRRDMIDEIGFLDEDFFLIYEDTDLNLRAQLAGWKVIYVPSAIAYHKVRSTIGAMSDTAIYYSLRNSELARIKNIPFGLFLRCLPEYMFGAFLEFLYFGVKHGKPTLYVRAKIDAIKLLPKMLKKRKRVMSGIKVKTGYFYGLMTPLWNKEFFLTKKKKFIRS